MRSWPTIPLGEAGRWLSGGTPSKADAALWSGPIPWVSPKDMKRPRINDAIDHVAGSAIGAGTQLAPVNSILMVVRGMILAHSFPVALATAAVAFNQDIKALVPREGLDPEYLMYWLEAQDRAVLALVAVANHGTKRLPTESLFAMRLPVPPVDEQRRIAAVLSAADAYTDQHRRVLSALDAVYEATIARIVAEQAASADVAALRSFARVEWGNTALTKASYVDAGVTAFSASGPDGFVAEGEHHGEGLVISAIGARCGRCFRAAGTWTAIKNTITISAVDAARVSLNWLYHLANRPGFWSSSGGAQPFIALGNARETQVLLPELPYQIQFAAVLDAIEARRQAEHRLLARTAQLKSALAHQLLAEK